jgi:PII-like signaling protein
MEFAVNRPSADNSYRILQEDSVVNYLVEAGGELPVVLSFVDMDEHVNCVLPKRREMAAHSLIVRENVVIEQGSLD